MEPQILSLKNLAYPFTYMDNNNAVALRISEVRMTLSPCVLVLFDAVKKRLLRYI
jgi:hypothetical protein